MGGWLRNVSQHRSPGRGCDDDEGEVLPGRASLTTAFLPEGADQVDGGPHTRGVLDPRDRALITCPLADGRPWLRAETCRELGAYGIFANGVPVAVGFSCPTPTSTPRDVKVSRPAP